MRNGSLELAMHPHVTPEQTPQHSPQRSTELPEIPVGSSNGISRAQPFDMWAAQNGTAEPSEQVRALLYCIIWANPGNGLDLLPASWPGVLSKSTRAPGKQRKLSQVIWGN